MPLRDAHGKTLANIFYVAYRREPQDAKRPITFVFNGGPGAASAYLHLGAIGPKTIAVTAKGEVQGPPPRLVDNDASWLDFTDLVFVDPVGTGYSRASDGKDERDFFGVEHDTESLADFIRRYLTDAAAWSRRCSSRAKAMAASASRPSRASCRRTAASRRAASC